MKSDRSLIKSIKHYRDQEKDAKFDSSPSQIEYPGRKSIAKSKQVIYIKCNHYQTNHRVTNIHCAMMKSQCIEVLRNESFFVRPPTIINANYNCLVRRQKLGKSPTSTPGTFFKPDDHPFSDDGDIRLLRDRCHAKHPQRPRAAKLYPNFGEQTETEFPKITPSNLNCRLLLSNEDHEMTCRSPALLNLKRAVSTSQILSVRLMPNISTCDTLQLLLFSVRRRSNRSIREFNGRDAPLLDETVSFTAVEKIELGEPLSEGKTEKTKARVLHSDGFPFPSRRCMFLI
ncbi:hypothetical protein KSP40_PGU022186 [Platanthera guangdongensis]|uniref:Uncharacterized protein n=1 Tax=Platanthera guangdongensis TaxID=2320717 RepID=A0ABR2MAM9_9ASPA